MGPHSNTRASSMSLPFKHAGALLMAICSVSQAVVIDVSWKTGMSTAAQAVSVELDDEVQFTWSNTHDVWKMADEAAYDACNFAGATLVGDGTSPDSITFSTANYNLGDVIYFSCSIGAHCNDNQKLTVTIVSDREDYTGPSAQAAPTLAAVSLTAATL